MSGGEGQFVHVVQELRYVVYSGRAAGSSHSDSGGEANMLCLPDNPDYLSRTSDSVEGDYTALTGAELHTWVAREDHKAYPSKLSRCCLLCTKSYHSNDSSKNSVPMKWKG